MHVAPFLHGTDAHSLISMPQSFPKDKTLISKITEEDVKRILLECYEMEYNYYAEDGN